MPKMASATSSSASAASPADDANGLASCGPLRPPPVFCEGKGEAAGHLAHPCRRRMRHPRQSSTPVSSRSSSHSPHIASARLGAQQLQPSEHGNNSAKVPVIHWRAASALTSAPTELWSDGVALGARHCSDDQERHQTVATGGSAVLEHYHVLELEEQLQYWRQRALQVENRALRRERALQARWEAEFAAAQVSSETLTRKLLDKLRRLQKQLNPRKRAVQQTEGQEQQSRSSSASADSTSTTPNLSTPGDSGHHCGGESEGTCSIPRVCGTNSVAYPRRFASEWAEENASLLNSPAGQQREQQQPNRSRSAANAAESCATSNEKSRATLQANLRDLCRAVLRCLSRSSLLREYGAVLCGNCSRNTHTTNDDDPEEPETARVAQALLDASRGRKASDSPSSWSLARPLLALQSALEHLDTVLRACVDDVVFASSGLTSTSAAAYARHPQRQPPGDEHRSADLEAQLRQARAALFQEQQRRAAVQSALDAAMHDMRDLAQAQQDNVSQLKIEARAAAEQAQQEYRANLERTRATLECDVVAATRRASAAEHQSMLRAQREAHWQARLYALKDERDGYARECALLKTQLALLQQARNATAAERAGQQQEGVDKAVLSVGPRDGAEAKPATAAASALVVPPVDSSPAPRVTWADAQMDRLTTIGQPSGFAAPSSVCRSPSRSLSYSPSPSTDKALRHAPGARADETARVHGAQLTSSASTATSGAPRLPSAFPSSLMVVVQPSVLAAPEGDGDAEVIALAQRPYGDDNSAARDKAGVPVDSEALEQAHFTPWHAPSRQHTSTAVDAAVVGTPLARMRAWEEKFKAILNYA
ncbi:conserved hypothetical protein [Leishmania infantum JPCM5]|uniref:Uncharacterized protein n=2 Tax=Leishmania infantum TaxID=5671 RepID=A4HWI1_LEIIN|nr:conserved hypothetical protein [Leishmania infantum JPCM5]CAC9472522.1 hypothetical_protein_-_conserved [Leishmania infantum]CAM66809.1 conserved hypothetical protein [Leishmania infantum JPCM5]SUZ40503.1 hypothetical_protein_-_conserved [Leishmania infantum]|eukprot:XP_001464422.1 conserved hypothetical protein [Leishmania infantum JPCM5]